MGSRKGKKIFSTTFRHLSKRIFCLPLFPGWCFIADFSSVQFSRSVVSDSLRPHGLQHARLPCPSPTPGAYSNSCPSGWWCHPAISSSVIPFFSCRRLFPALQISWIYLILSIFGVVGLGEQYLVEGVISLGFRWRSWTCWSLHSRWIHLSPEKLETDRKWTLKCYSFYCWRYAALHALG